MSKHDTPTIVATRAIAPSPFTGTTGDAGLGCPECGETAVGVADGGIRYCEECGLVLTDEPIERSEPGWRLREERRMGPTSSISHESVGTVIDTSGGDRNSRILAHHNNRLEYSTRALKAGLREVRNLCTACELSEATEARAAYLYRRATREGLLKGRSREEIAGACTYTAARRYSQPVTLSDIATASPVSEQRISRAYRTLLQELGLGLQPPEPREFLPRVATRAGVPFRVQRRARELLETATDADNHIGQSPSGVAAAAVYAAAVACDEPLTQEAIADAAGTSTVTVSRQYQQFREFL